MQNILLVEDDIPLARLVAEWLKLEHYSVTITNNGEDAKGALSQRTFDLIVLDLSLPDVGGMEILQSFRQGGGQAPVLILSGRQAIESKLEGLELGADDYMTKPFDAAELSARVKAILRRPLKYVGDVLRLGDLEIDCSARGVRVADQAIKLEPLEYALLEFLMRHQDQLFSAEDLLSRVWPQPETATAQAAVRMVGRLRKKLEDSSQFAFIRAVWGEGYVLDSTVLAKKKPKQMY